MQMSARILGQKFGMSGEEMNRALFKLGYLKGIPGDYSPTEKAMRFVKECHYHRGNGGYDRYNRFWTTRTFDESILNELKITPELISEVREELSAIRKARSAERLLAQQIAEKEFLAKMGAKEAAERAAEAANKQEAEIIAGLKKFGKGSVIVLVVCGVAYEVYKAAPHVKSWWDERKQRKFEEGEEDDNKENDK